MGRKSKRDTITLALLENGEGNQKVLEEVMSEVVYEKKEKYKVGIYIRLSNKWTEEGGSVSNQRTFLTEIVQSKKDMKFIKEYIDNGATGTNFTRHGFETMMEDVKKGKINCIVVKDFSRLGRQAIAVGNYLVNVFPMLGVRFISVNDGYDSIEEKSTYTLEIMMKNLCHEYYAKEISRKTKASRELKRKKGEHLMMQIPYGYKKGNGKLVINDEVREIVERIYKMAENGETYRGIARILNDEKILSPREYKIKKGEYKRDKELYLWKTNTITNILTHPNYAGDTVYWRKSNQCNDEQIQYVENTHEAIISRELFEKVQKIVKEKKLKSKKQMEKCKDIIHEKNCLIGKIICADCGKIMSKKRIGKKYYYCCSAYLDSSGRTCTKKTIASNQVTEAILQSIVKQIEIIVEVKKVIESILQDKHFIMQKKNAIKNIDKQQREIETIDERIKGLYEDYVAEIFTLEEYFRHKECYKQEKIELEEKQENLSIQLEYFEKILEKNHWIKIYTEWEQTQELTKEMIDIFIETVKICEGKKIEISFKHQDGYEDLINFVSNYQSSITF